MTPQIESSEILIVPMPTSEDDYIPSGYEPLRGDDDEHLTKTGKAVAVKLSDLSAGFKEFMTQLSILLGETSGTVGDFALDEIEVSAGINASGKLMLFGALEAGAGVEGGLKLVFKRANHSR
jgi:hypothetical protein